MEKFKPFELLNWPIWSAVAEGESTFEPTTHAPTSARLGRIRCIRLSGNRPVVISSEMPGKQTFAKY